MNDAETAQSACQCGHPAGAHLKVDGFTCSPGVTIDGHAVIPDVWVCSGGRLADMNDPNLSPWDYVCGCVLHRDPSFDPRSAGRRAVDQHGPALRLLAG